MSAYSFFGSKLGSLPVFGPEKSIVHTKKIQFSGEKGISHGVELYKNILDFAYERLSETLQSAEVSAFNWCQPQFFLGNSFYLKAQMRYDRIYCGERMPNDLYRELRNFLKIGGIFVMPRLSVCLIFFF